MGPLPIPSLESAKADRGENRAAAIKWIDDGKDIKEKLKTNKSKEDLIIKAEDPSKLQRIDCHKKLDNKPKKSAIKPFKIDNNKLTGLENFTDISKNPLSLPDYYGLNSNNSDVLPLKDAKQTDQQKKEHKAKRPDDKIDRESKSLRRQNDRNLERRQRPLDDNDKKQQDENKESAP